MYHEWVGVTAGTVGRKIDGVVPLGLHNPEPERT